MMTSAKSCSKKIKRILSASQRAASRRNAALSRNLLRLQPASSLTSWKPMTTLMMKQSNAPKRAKSVPAADVVVGEVDGAGVVVRVRGRRSPASRFVKKYARQPVLDVQCVMKITWTTMKTTTIWQMTIWQMTMPNCQTSATWTMK